MMNTMDDMLTQQPPVLQIYPFTHAVQANPLDKYKKILFYLGSTEIFLGALSCLFGLLSIIAAVSERFAVFTFIGHGIWCGIPLVICGVLGVLIYSNPSKAMYNANMALCIITANFMILLVIFSSLSAVIDGHLENVIIYHSINAIVGFVGLVVLVIHSAYCCAGICCNGDYSVPVAMQYTNDGRPIVLYPSYPQGVVSVPISQQMSFPLPNPTFPVA